MSVAQDVTAGLPWLPFLDKGDHPPCSTTDPELFFPQPGQMQGDQPDPTKICLGCPWRMQCLEWALENDEYGVWGGTTQTHRHQIKSTVRRFAS